MAYSRSDNGQRAVKDVAYGTTPTITTSFQEIECGFVPDEVWLYCYNTSSKGACFRFAFEGSSCLGYGVYRTSSSSSAIENGLTAENMTKGTNGFNFKSNNTNAIWYNKTCRYVAIKYAD